MKFRKSALQKYLSGIKEIETLIALPEPPIAAEADIFSDFIYQLSSKNPTTDAFEIKKLLTSILIYAALLCNNYPDYNKLLRKKNSKESYYLIKWLNKTTIMQFLAAWFKALRKKEPLNIDLNTLGLMSSFFEWDFLFKYCNQHIVHININTQLTPANKNALISFLIALIYDTLSNSVMNHITFSSTVNTITLSDRVEIINALGRTIYPTTLQFKEYDDKGLLSNLNVAKFPRTEYTQAPLLRQKKSSTVEKNNSVRFTLTEDVCFFKKNQAPQEIQSHKKRNR